MKTTRNLFCILFLISIVSEVIAQTGQGTFFISGSTSLSMAGGSDKIKTDDGDNDPTKTINFVFAPSAAIFVIDDLAIGAQFPITIYRSKSPNDYKTISSSVSFAPLVRYYFLSGNFRPIAQASFGGGVEGYKTVDPDGDSNKSNSVVFLLNAGGGISLFLNDNIAMDGLLNYGFVRSKPSDDNNNNRRTISHEVSFRIGITVFL